MAGRGNSAALAVKGEPVTEDASRAGAFLARAAIQAAREPDIEPMQGLDVPACTA